MQSFRTMTELVRLSSHAVVRLTTLKPTLRRALLLSSARHVSSSDPGTDQRVMHASELKLGDRSESRLRMHQHSKVHLSLRSTHSNSFRKESIRLLLHIPLRFQSKTAGVVSVCFTNPLCLMIVCPVCSLQAFPGAERIVCDLGSYPVNVTVAELMAARIVQDDRVNLTVSPDGDAVYFHMTDEEEENQKRGLA